MRKEIIVTSILGIVTSLSVFADSGVMTYQGRVQSGGTDFTGTGQFKLALVTSSNSSFTTQWSNDGTSVAGSEPVDAVSVPVNMGLFAVGLGDTGLMNMTALDAALFEQPDLELRIWFNDGINGFAVLDPPQPLTAAPYAFKAVNADTASSAATADLATTVALGSVDAGHLAEGAAAANLAVDGQAGVASGGLVLSETENAALVDAGYVEIGSTVLSGYWKNHIHVSAPAERRNHTAVWTGSEMIVWGGIVLVTRLDDGGQYDPIADSWTTVALNGRPAARFSHAAVWTGTEMIVFGGFGSESLNDTWSYSPARAMILYQKL
jgi:hypothetical protein